jgi:DNA-binding MarR family transcriptional regulator
MRRSTPEHVDFALDDFFPHIINRITSRIRNDFEPKTKPLGIAIEQWRVLICLLTKGPQRITRLAELTSIELPTMSYLLKRMERDRFVARQSDQEDARITRVSLTGHGRSMVLRLLPMVRRYEEIAFRGFTTAQIRMIKTHLKTILRNVEEIDLPGLSERSPKSRVSRA